MGSEEGLIAKEVDLVDEDDDVQRFSRLKSVLRKLRIVSTLFFGLACLVSIAFWARSYAYSDSIFMKVWPSEHIQVSSGGGRMCVWFENSPIPKSRWSSYPDLGGAGTGDRIPIFHLGFWPTFARLYLAHWFLVVTTGLLAIFPWCPRSFSTRDMMIALTAVSVIVALITVIDTTF